ncbi:MAG: DegV family protein [Firmicutes bacterium]|nr:DegV family protein [Bacillota bacterium]
MPKIILSSDSTCDLSKELILKYDVRIVPLIILLGANEYIDGKNIQPDEIYEYVQKTGNLPKTAAVSVVTLKEHFSDLTKNGDSVLHISISNRLSASWNNATIAAKEFKNVHVVDGFQLSTGTSVLLLKAHDLLSQGKSINEVVSELEILKLKTSTSFAVNKLDYLHKGGRCSGLTLLGANILKIHPMVSMQEGFLKPHKKFRGNMEVVLSNYIDYLAESYPSYDDTRAFITHTAIDPALLELANRKVKENFKFKEILDTTAGSTITCHCGKGTLGLLFLTNQNIVPISK